MQNPDIKGYAIIRPIFQGGMTDLYVAKTNQDTRVVLRFLKEIYARDRALRKRFLHSADILKKLRHPNIVQLVEAGMQQKRPYMVLEYIEAKTLRERMVQRDPQVVQGYLRILRHMAEALYTIHQAGYLHLDFKPENLLLTDSGRLVVIDFDLAVKRGRRPVRLRNGSGTPAYVAPEVLVTQRADERADIFSFGVIAYELVTQHKPFERNSMDASIIAQTNPDTPPLPIERFAPDLPRALKEMIGKCLAKDTAKRYPAVSLVLKSLDAMR